MTINKSSVLTQEEILANLNPRNSRVVRAVDSKEIDMSFEDINSFGSKESIMDMVRSVGSYNKMLSEKITFINSPLTASIPFTRENLYLICAYTGSGKSTVAANISYPLWKEGKKILVISNEETQTDVLFRIGCLELGLNFNDYKKGVMSQDLQKQVMLLFPEISKYVKVLDIAHKDGLMSKIEGVKKALELIKDKDYSCAMIDYYQLVQSSISDPSKTRYDVLNELRLYLGQYIKSANLPIVLFVQLYSQGKRPSKDIDARIKECSAIVEPATVILEVVPNWELETSDFLIHKDRFGLAGNKISCGFDKGRFVKITDDEIEDRKNGHRRSKAEERLTGLENGIKNADK
jgi:hypothetical protein